MSDVECPYCGLEQEIQHDGGYGYEDGEEYDQNCACGKDFKYTTNIIFSYKTSCQDGDHKMEPFSENWPDIFECTRCDYFEKRRAQEKEE